MRPENSDGTRRDQLQQTPDQHGDRRDESGEHLTQSHRENKRLEVGLASTDHHAVQRAIANAQTKIAFQHDLGGRELSGTQIGGIGIRAGTRRAGRFRNKTVRRSCSSSISILRRVAPRHIVSFHDRHASHVAHPEAATRRRVADASMRRNATDRSLKRKRSPSAFAFQALSGKRLPGVVQAPDYRTTKNRSNPC